MDLNALLSLNQVVSSYQNEANDFSPSTRKRLMQLAVECLVHLNIYTVPSYEKTYLEVNSLNYVDVPTDFVDYYKVGIVLQGKIWTLSINDNITIPNAISCGEEVGDTDNQIPIDIPDYYHYSLGGINIAYHRYDPETRRIYFDGDMVGQQIVLEYISSGVSLSGNTYVPRELGKVLKDFIHWKSIQRLPDVAISHKQLAKQDYDLSLGEYVRFKNSFTIDDLRDAINKNRRQTL